MEVLSNLETLIDQVNIKPKPIPKGSNLPVVKEKQKPIPLLLKLSTFTVAAVAAALTILVVQPDLMRLSRSRGLVLADIGIIKDSGDTRSFHLNGKISNTTDHTMQIPTLRITLVDANGKSLQYWDISGDARIIGPHGVIPFATDNLDVHFDKGTRFVVELGNPLELALRSKPPASNGS